MRLPVLPPVAPMLARLVREMPDEEGLAYEPKWDGFRCIAFRDGDEVELGSRNARPLTRYFPEVVSALLAEAPERCVVDGEIVIAGASGLDFEALLQRIHPAESRVQLLASLTPASFVAFDLLALDEQDLRRAPWSERRAALEQSLAGAAAPLHLTPCTRDVATARDWFERFEGAGLDGVVAKPVDLRYREGERAMLKVKHARTADCVVGGFRWHKDGAGVGSLLLGLYDDARSLQHVGVASSFSAAMRRQLVGELAGYRDSGEDHPWSGWSEHLDAPRPGRRPGATSRWNAGRDLGFEPLRPALVCEVAYDHLQGDRFRHATTFVRWRPDRAAESCTYSQLDAAVPEELAAVFGAG